jgi:hypothetical protein
MAAEQRLCHALGKRGPRIRQHLLDAAEVLAMPALNSAD